jgi:hypothetical protein
MHTRRDALVAFSLALAFAAASGAAAFGQGQPTLGQSGPPPRGQPDNPPPPPPGGGRQAEPYSIDQATSWQAQLSTYAFSGLAFLTGTYGADTFLPPGKVADYFGFQYMRDIDAHDAGHNNMFLTNIANNVLAVLDHGQRAQLLSLAEKQAPLYDQFADRRLVLIKAFTQELQGARPAGTTKLSEKAVEAWLADSFELDGWISADRAAMYGGIVSSLTAAQKTALSRLKFGDSRTWPAIRDPIDRRALPHDVDILVMTYASEFFSWYAGSGEADAYFCPERHATYFGGFYMKDYPAMGHNDYFIPTALTGDSGAGFMSLLDPSQAQALLSLKDEDAKIMVEIVGIRRQISNEFRSCQTGDQANDAKVLELSRRYGELDGRLSWLLAEAFASIGKSLTPEQRAAMVKLRHQTVFPDGLYRYSDPIPMPPDPDTRAFFE